MASDHRALPDHILDMYLYPFATWGLVLVLLFIWEVTPWAMALLMPLALWQALLTAWWGVATLRRFDKGDLTHAEAQAGARSVGRILASTSLAPVLVFFGRDPFALASWSTSAGVLFIAAIAWFGVQGLVALQRRWAYIAAMAFGCMALPISTTGSVTVAAMLGWYQVVVDHTPVPDVIAPIKQQLPTKRD
jgi:hypothetical protein